jgi:type VI secretion system protein ImpE
MNAQTLLQSGQLKAAIELLSKQLKAEPNSTENRGLLAELLCIQGELDRADKQFDLLSDQSPENGYTIAVMRQLIRAEQARLDCYQQGRVPTFFDKPNRYLQDQLQALSELQAGNAKQASTLLNQTEQKQRPKTGTAEAKTFSRLRDLDDICSYHFEVLTYNGHYCWLPQQKVKHLRLNQPKRPIDLIWRQAHFMLNDDTELDAVIPAIYAKTFKQDDESLRLGHGTDWHSENQGPTLGLGLRMFLLDEQAVSINDLSELHWQE